MKLTKYEHACFTLEKDGKVLVVDPGGFSTDFLAPEDVVGVIITHHHGDHLDTEHLAQIFAKNDEVLVLGPADAMEEVEVENKKIIESGEKIEVGPFSLEFFGGIHALIHESIPRVQNLGVLIDDLLYYPGDSLYAPGKPIDTLAIPAAAPWMKIGEAMDFLIEVAPRFAFPTHDAVASDIGKSLADRMLGGVAAQHDIEYKRLDSPVDI